MGEEAWRSSHALAFGFFLIGMMMDCKKSSCHIPVVYISWLVLVSSVMAPFSKAFEHLCWYIICPLSFVVFQLLPLHQVPPVQCPPHSLVSPPWLSCISPSLLL